MSENRLEILQMLADGKIDAEGAAAMMNGGAASEIVADSLTEAEVDSAETQPIIEKQPEEVIEIEVDEEPVVLAKVKSEEATKERRQSRLRVEISGNPIKANLDIEVPLSLLEFGKQLGAMFSPDLGDVTWNDLNFEADTGEQHIHIYTEQAQ